MNVIIKILVICFFISSYSQETKINRTPIYIEFNENSGNAERFRGIKFYNKNEEGIIFNNLVNGSFLFKDGKIPDTLCLKHLKDYKISSFEEIRSIEKKWRKENHKKLIKKYGFPYPPFDKNGIFKTYIIEVLKDQDRFVIYPVTWRNLNIKQ